MPRPPFDPRAALTEAATELGLALDAQQHSALVAWLEELLRWNARVNLTSLTEPRQALEGHVVDALAALRSAERAVAALEASETGGAAPPVVPLAGRLLDIGTGAGVPAFAWALLRPALRVVAADAVSKKIAFVRHTARTVHFDAAPPGELPRLNGWHGRVGPGEAPPPSAPFDLVTARAVTEPAGLATLAAEVVRPGGVLLVLLGREVPDETAWRASLAPNWSGLAVDRYALPRTGAARAVAAVRRAIGPA